MWKKDAAGISMNYMELGSHFMGHGVVHSQEGVGKCHTCNSCCIMHLFPGFKIIWTIFDGSWKILEYKLDGLKAESVCKVIGEDRYISFYGMGKDIHTCHGCRTGRKLSCKLSIHNGDGRSQGVICKRILLSIGLIGNDSKRSYFRACT